jgi:hypothetical protein
MKGVKGINKRRWENDIKTHLAVSRKGADCVNLTHDESSVGHLCKR